MPEVPYPISVITPQSLGILFTGNASAPTINPSYPGLFLLATCNANLTVNYFGTTLDIVGNLIPENMPDLEESKQLR